MHEINHLLEAALYVDDLDRAEAFYTGLHAGMLGIAFGVVAG